MLHCNARIRIPAGFWVIIEIEHCSDMKKKFKKNDNRTIAIFTLKRGERVN